MSARSSPLPAQSAAAQINDADSAAAASKPTSPVAACPLNRSWKAVEAEVVGEDDVPLSGIALELGSGSSKALHDRTGTDGRVRFEGLEDGEYTLTLLDLDQDAWSLIDTVAITSDRNQTPGPAAWEASAAAPTPPPPHTVQDGECVSSIAFDAGFFPDSLWDYAANKDLKKLRDNGNILYPGDVVAIPPKRRKLQSATTGKRYRLRRKGVPESIRICFVDRDGKPRAGVPYLLKLVTQQGETLRNKEGKTTDDGFLIEPIPPNADRGEVILGQGAGQQIYPVLIGRVSPVDEVQGLQSRLSNLGYYFSEHDGNMTEELQSALEAFQIDHDLPITGELDDATRKKLKEMHLS